MSPTKILFFATLRDRAATRALEMELPPGTTIAQLKSLLIQQRPALAGLLEHCLASINHEYRFDEDPIPPAAEVAFFPPVSGG